MKNQVLLFVLSSILFLTSCTVTKTATTKTLDIYGAGVIQKPVLVDLDVKEIKVTGIASNGTIKEDGVKVGSTSSTTTIDELKNRAVAEAVKNAKADVLVEPKFEIETTGSVSTVTVVGYPATYKNFRSIKTEDLELIKAGVLQKAEVAEPKAPIKTGGGSFLSIILVAGALIGLVLAFAPN